MKYTNCLQYAVIATVATATIACAATEQNDHEEAKPNVIIILADDVGYGDLGCYGATKVKTPNLDRLAAQGTRFTDGYVPAAVCTPTRFSMLTGKWAFRQRGTGILPGDAALIIEPGSVTLPSILKSAGYTTGVVGKWHLGLGTGRTDYSSNDIKPGPAEIGFDYSFIFPATNDRVPTIYMEGNKVVNNDPKDPLNVSYIEKIGNEPTGSENPELLNLRTRKKIDHHNGTIVNGVSRIGWMSGGKKARWADGDLTDTFAAKAVAFIERNKENPFFLYVATHTAHEPFVPAKRFIGTSDAGTRGDVIQELDWHVGQIMKALEDQGIADRTLVLFASDNGAAWPANRSAYKYDAQEGNYRYNGALNGGKADPYEGGTRVPFIARWPKMIKSGTTSSQIISLVDMQATCAAIAGVDLPKNAGQDTQNMLPALLGTGAGRDFVIEQHYRGAGNLAIRKGTWKLIPRDEGKDELFDLSEDLGETKNLALQNPEVVKSMKELLDDVRRGNK